MENPHWPEDPASTYMSGWFLLSPLPSDFIVLSAASPDACIPEAASDLSQQQSQSQWFKLAELLAHFSLFPPTLFAHT